MGKEPLVKTLKENYSFQTKKLTPFMKGCIQFSKIPCSKSLSKTL
jgi:hypothetical protein